jgi:hypothetical protein
MKTRCGRGGSCFFRHHAARLAFVPQQFLFHIIVLQITGSLLASHIILLFEITVTPKTKNQKMPKNLNAFFYDNFSSFSLFLYTCLLYGLVEIYLSMTLEPLWTLAAFSVS